MRHEVEGIDPDQAEMRPLNDALDDTLSQPRSTMSNLIASPHLASAARRHTNTLVRAASFMHSL
jgi:hypothetical protein